MSTKTNPHLSTEAMNFIQKFDHEIIPYATWEWNLKDCLRYICCRHQSNNASNLRITGMTGIGKSTMVREIMAQLGGSKVKPVQTDDGIYYTHAALHITLPGKMTVKSLIQAILEAMNYPKLANSSLTEPKLRTLLTNAIIKSGLKTLFIDEFHHIKYTKRGAMIDYSNVVLFLKDLCKQTNLCIVPVGTQEVDEIIDSDKEVCRLFNLGVDIESIAYEEDPNSDFMVLLSGLSDLVEKATEGALKSRFDTAQLPKQIWLNASGNVWSIKEMIKQACIVSIESNGRHQPEQLLKRVESQFRTRMRHPVLAGKSAFDLNAKELGECLANI